MGYVIEDGGNPGGAWPRREYHFYLIFGVNVPGREPWLRKEWTERFEPLFRQVIELSPQSKNTGLRVLEYKKKENSEFYGEHKLGRLRWDAKSHDKWTIGDENKDIVFSHFAAWTPIWTLCDKTKNWPDAYVSIDYERAFDDNREKLERSVASDFEYQFDTLVTLAVAADVGEVPENVIRVLSDAFCAKRTVYTTRSWLRGRKDEGGKWSFINSIADTSSMGMYKDAQKLNFHMAPFADVQWEPYWKVIR
jgi:hypothetical protein